MKRVAISILLMVFAATFSLAQAPTVPGLKGKTIEISLWTHDDANRGPMEKQFIAEFMAANPGITVKYSSYPSGKILETLTTAFRRQSGTRHIQCCHNQRHFISRQWPHCPRGLQGDRS